MSSATTHSGKVAVIDSGVGGLSILAELREILPYNSLIYYADSASCPYGGRSTEEIEKLTISVVEKVVKMGAEIVVVACNTMTAAAIHTLRERWTEIDFVGMEPAVKPAILTSHSHIVGVLATRATLRGELYNSTKEYYGEGTTVIETAGVGLVEFVEKEQYDSPQCKELLRGYIEEMVEKGADKIVLGCTHYPFLTRAIKEIIAPYSKTIEIINPAPAVALRAKELAQKRGIIQQGKGSVEYHTSGTKEQLEILRNFLENYN